jgi:A/G-specific adenine glycosylase
VLLQQRPPSGLWGGLWSLPQAADLRDAERETGLALQLESARVLAPLRHTFSHFHLDITPVLVRPRDAGIVMEGLPLLWYNIQRPASVGLAAPVKRLLECLPA